MVRKGLTEKVTFKQTLEGSKPHSHLRKEHLSQEEEPTPRMHLACVRNSKKLVWLEPSEQDEEYLVIKALGGVQIIQNLQKLLRNLILPEVK